MITRTAHRLAPVALIILAPLLVFWRLVFAGEVLYWGVPLTQFFPWHTLINRALAVGQLPLWTDLLGNGAPLLANHQTAVFYPPNLLFRLLPVEHALGYTVVLHVIGAGLAALYWGRTLGLGGLGRTVLALTYALGGYIMGRTQFITMVAAYAWLPLLLALTERLALRRRPADAAWLGGALALQFLAGHAQTWFYSLLLVLAYGLYRALGADFGGGRGSIPAALAGDPAQSTWGWRDYHGPTAVESHAALARVATTCGLLALAVVLSLALSAVQLVPTAELALNSQRSGGADWDFAMTYSYWPWRLFTLLAPDLFGNPALGNYAGYATYWEDHAYLGVLPLIFALTALVGGVRAALRWTSEIPDPEKARGTAASARLLMFFGLLLPVTIVLAMGSHTPIYPFLFKYVPGFGFFQAPARLMLWFAVGASTLAGIGAHSFRLTYRKQYVLRLSVAGAVAMLSVALSIDSAGMTPGKVYAPALIHLAVLLGLAAGLLLLRGRMPDDSDTRVTAPRLPRSAWCVLVVVLLCADLMLAAFPLTPSIAGDLYRSPRAGGEALPAMTAETRLHIDLDYQYDVLFNQYFRFSTFGPPDVSYWQDLRNSMLPNLSAVDGVVATGNNEPLAVGRWKTLLELTRHADRSHLERLLQVMNTGYVLTDRPDPQFQPAGGTTHLYRLPDARPRAWLVPDAEVITTPERLLARLQESGFDPRTTVLLETPAVIPGNSAAAQLPEKRAGLPKAGDTSEPDGTVALQEAWNGRTIRLTSARPGYLVLAYTHYPGWQATLDGHPVEILRANYAFSAIPVPSGPHDVVLEYRPSSMVWGSSITALALLAIVGTFFWRKWTWRRHQRADIKSAAPN